MRVGFIGLGNMGNPMAWNLLKAGYDLTIHDVRREAGQNLEGCRGTMGEQPESGGSPV